MHCDEVQPLYCDVVTLCMNDMVAVQSPRRRRADSVVSPYYCLVFKLVLLFGVKVAFRRSSSVANAFC